MKDNEWVHNPDDLSNADAAACLTNNGHPKCKQVPIHGSFVAGAGAAPGAGGPPTTGSTGQPYSSF